MNRLRTGVAHMFHNTPCLRKLHSEGEGLCNLYCLPDVVRALRWAGHVAGEKRNTYRILVGKPEGSRLSGRPRYGWRL